VADWKFELWITQTATEDYERLMKDAEGAVSGWDGPLPLSSDPRLRTRLAAVTHYERTRRLLKSIKNPNDVGLDRGLFGPAHFVRYRSELNTCVYFTRVATTPAMVLVCAITDSPIDPYAIRKIVRSGNIGLLEQYGLPPIEWGPTDGHIN
jgi:hypothetical protein